MSFLPISKQEMLDRGWESCDFVYVQNFPQFIVIHTIKGFGIVNKAEIDGFFGTLLLFP